MKSIKYYEGPKGGLYWLDENNKKHYIKKSSKAAKSIKPIKENKKNTKSNKPTVASITYKNITVEVPDYEHSGDLRGYEQYIKSEYPNAINFNSWEERDKEAEAEYEHEYGELDEPIYRGFVSFDVPSEDVERIKEQLI